MRKREDVLQLCGNRVQITVITPILHKPLDSLVRIQIINKDKREIPIFTEDMLHFARWSYFILLGNVGYSVYSCKVGKIKCFEVLQAKLFSGA